MLAKASGEKYLDITPFLPIPATTVLLSSDCSMDKILDTVFILSTSRKITEFIGCNGYAFSKSLISP